MFTMGVMSHKHGKHGTRNIISMFCVTPTAGKEASFWGEKRKQL